MRRGTTALMVGLTLGLLPQLASAQKAGGNARAQVTNTQADRAPKAGKQITCRLWVKGFIKGEESEVKSARLSFRLVPKVDGLTAHKINRATYCRIDNGEGRRVNVIGLKREGHRMVAIIGGGERLKMPAGNYTVTTLAQKTLKPDGTYRFKVGDRSLLRSFDKVGPKRKTIKRKRRGKVRGG